MKEFTSLAVVPQRPELLWATVRDRMPELVPLLDDVESVTVENRTEQPDGTVRLVNTWRARPAIPAALGAVLRPEMLAWTDRAEWHSGGRECRWRIDPHFHPERIVCSGSTLYEPAMGGRGTRVTVAGSMAFSAANLVGVPVFLEAFTAQAIEAFLTAVIPRNFQKLVRAAAQLLAEGAAAPH